MDHVRDTWQRDPYVIFLSLSLD